MANGAGDLSNWLTVVIMLVAVYAHLGPTLPAEVLPFQSKPPVVTAIALLLGLLNRVLRRKGEEARLKLEMTAATDRVERW